MNLVSVRGFHREDIYRVPRLVPGARNKIKYNLVHYGCTVFLAMINCCLKIFLNSVIMQLEAGKVHQLFWGALKNKYERVSLVFETMDRRPCKDIFVAVRWNLRHPSPSRSRGGFGLSHRPFQLVPS